MGKQKEGSLQERIQSLLKKRGAYCFKNHGDMTTEPGRPDIVCGYKGLFIAIEVKVDDNEPSPQQGIHCRNIWKANGIAFITWDTKTVEKVLDYIDKLYNNGEFHCCITFKTKEFMQLNGIDDGTRW